MTLPLPWPYVGGAFDKPKSLEDLAERVQTNFERLARQFPVPPGGVSGWYSGEGTPEGAVTASVGALFTRTDGGAGSTLYVKESGTGNTGWVAK